MGRTLLPYSMQLDLVEERFSRFRRALRKQDQEICDRLFRVARKQLQAGVMAANPNPFDSMAMTMMIEMQKQVDELSARVWELEQAKDIDMNDDMADHMVGDVTNDVNDGSGG